MEVFGCEYVQTYGLTETSPYLTLSLLKPHLRALPRDQQLAFRAKTGRPFASVALNLNMPLRKLRGRGARCVAAGPLPSPSSPWQPAHWAR